MCGAGNLMHKNRHARRFFRWNSPRPLAMLFRQRESAEAAVPRVRRARFLRSALLLRGCGFGSGCDGLRPGMSVRFRRLASSGGLPSASGAEASGFAPSSGSHGGLREAAGGSILSGGGLRVVAAVDAADVGRDTKVARDRRWRGSGTGGGSSRAWGYGRSLAVIDRCSAAPVSAKVPMPPERPTCPVAIARGLDRLRRRRVRSGRIASRWVPASAPDASFFITTPDQQTTRFWGEPPRRPKFW